MTAITKALADVSRSYVAAKATVATGITDAMLAHGPGGMMQTRTDLAQAHEQLQHFTGWVYTSIRPIAQRIAGQPIYVGKRKDRMIGTKAAKPEPLQSHPLLDLLADPNDLMVAWSLIYITVASLELTGRALWWLPDGDQILPIPTQWITGFEGTTSFAAFKVRPPNTGEEFSIPSDECVYAHYPSPADPHAAISPLQAVAGAVDADEAITDSQVTSFRRGIHPTHALIVGKQPMAGVSGFAARPRLSNSQQNQIIGAIRKRYSGVQNHGEPLILDGLIEDVRRLSNTPSEMDWLNSGKDTKARIQQAFGTNAIINGEIEGANRASALVAEEIFITETINPKIELLSQTLTEWLSPMFGGDIQVWIEPCVPRDAEMQLKRISLAAQHGVLTADELREFAGLVKDANFAGLLVGGQNMKTTNPIAAGIGAMIDQAMAQRDAEELMTFVEQNYAHKNENP